MSELIRKDLKLVMLPLRNCARQNAFYYKSATECWLSVWEQLYREYKYDNPLFLDNLYRHDEAACIFTPEKCAGMILFRTVDFALTDFSRDSYFKEWNPQDVMKLVEIGQKVFMSTFLTVDPEFRSHKAASGFKIKEVLLDIMVKRFLQSGADVIAGIARRDRKMHDDSYILGARCLHEDIPYMGGRFQVDLVTFARAEIHQNPNVTIRKTADALWEARLELDQTAAAVKAA